MLNRLPFLIGGTSDLMELHRGPSQVWTSLYLDGPLAAGSSPPPRLSFMPTPDVTRTEAVIRAMWGCDQGHDYTMDADSSCGALLLDSALGVKWTWDKDSAPRLPQHRGFNPTGAAPQSSQGKAAAAGAETETLPSMDTSRLPSDGDPVGPGPGPPSQPSLPPGGAPGRRLLWAI